MYIPKSFENKNIEQLHEIITKHNFATLISADNDEISVTHVPALLKRHQGQYGSLIWHLANLNPHTANLDGSKPALFIFQGPHAYISPAWYEQSQDVPTWNYAVVHAHGTPKAVSKDRLSDDLSLLVEHHEAMLDTNYHVDQQYKKKLMEHITGFEMEITRIEGKFKLGQNRCAEDQISMVNHLRKQNRPELLALADIIEASRI